MNSTPVLTACLVKIYSGYILSKLNQKGENYMLWTIVSILLGLWVLGLIFDIAGGLIHILLIIGLIVIAYKAIKGRAT